MILIKEIRKKLIDYFKDQNDFNLAKPTGLANPNIPVAYNPSAGFLEIRDYVHTDNDLPVKKFFVNEKCLRVLDTSLVGISNRHLSFFEMFAFFFAGSGKMEIVDRELIGITTDIIENVFNLDKQNIIITLFGGGDVVNIKNIPSEKNMKELWVEHGISEENIIETNGLRNFVANYQWGYAGPSYEIFYKNNNDLIEIASTNKYKYRVQQFIHKGKQNYQLLSAKNFAYGTGFGLERLSLVLNKTEKVFDIPELKEILDYLYSLIPNNLQKLSILDEEHLKQIADGVRAILFIMSENVKPSSHHSREKILRNMIKNTLEELNYLGLYEKAYEILEKISEIVDKQYCEDYKLETESILAFLKEYIPKVEVSKKYSHLMQRNQ